MRNNGITIIALTITIIILLILTGVTIETLAGDTQRYYSISNNGKVTFFGDASKVEKDMQNIILGDNLLNTINLKKDKYISSTNGTEIEYTGWSSSDYIDIENYKRLLIVSENNMFLDKYNAIYNESKGLIRTLSLSKSKIINEVLGEINASIAVINLNDNEKYLRVSQESGTMERIKIYPILNDDFNSIIDFDVKKSFLDEYDFGKNIFENTQIVDKTYIGSEKGEKIPYSSWDSTGFVDVEKLGNIAIAYENTNPVNEYSAMYNSEKEFVSKLSVIKTTFEKKEKL